MPRVEKNIEGSWVTWFHRVCPAGYAVKLGGQGFRGLPDRMVLAPGGKLFFIEFKTARGRVRPLQQEIHRRLAAIGFTVYVCRSVQEAKDVCQKEGVYCRKPA